MNSIYNTVIKAKNETLIPVLNSGKTIESKYDPQKDALRQLSLFNKKYNFYLVFGLGSGILVSELSKSNSIVFVVEKNEESYNFLFSNFPSVEEFKLKKNIILTTINNFNIKLLESYIPALHGDLKIIEQKNWCEEIENDFFYIKSELEKTLEKISSDFSVQSHFGKIWQNNIINNLKLSKDKASFFSDINSNKIAAVIAAGPSLDETIQIINTKRNDFFIIATDTAYSVLVKKNIFPEIVVSLDGQCISYSHFFENRKTMNNTCFYFDLCGNFSVINKLKKLSVNYEFFKTGHPLSEFVNFYSNNSIHHLNSGSGTVTIAAVNLAIDFGFNLIQVYGADFGYINNKPYAKGTYLDNNFNLSSNKINTFEKQFCRLMYRTELINLENKRTTAVLDNYRISFESFLISNNISFTQTENIYFIENKRNNKNIQPFSLTCSYEQFVEKLKKINEYTVFLPYYAWIRNTTKIDSLIELENIAHSALVRYN